MTDRRRREIRRLAADRAARELDAVIDSETAARLGLDDEEQAEFLDEISRIVAGIRDAARQAGQQPRPTVPGITTEQALAGAQALGAALSANQPSLTQLAVASTGPAAVVETDEERELREDREETERSHAAGDHQYCGPTCEVEFPSELLRNTILVRAIPGSASMLDELLRRAAAGLSDTQPTVDRAAVRERVRLAIAKQWLDETGSGRTVDELDDFEFGTLADAVLAALGKTTTPAVEEDETR